MGQQILVIGLGTFGSIVAGELAALGHEVMGCDHDPRLVAEHADRLTQAFELDATDPKAIAAIGPADFDEVVVALDPSATIFATMILERSGAKRILARAASELDGEILRRVGASRVVYTDHQVATWVAHTIDLAGALDFIRLERRRRRRPPPARIRGRRTPGRRPRRSGPRTHGSSPSIAASEVLIDPPPDTRDRGRRQRAHRRAGGTVPGARPVIERMFYHAAHGRLGDRRQDRAAAVPDGVAPPSRTGRCAPSATARRRSSSRWAATRTERWTYICACGDVYLWERRD